MPGRMAGATGFLEDIVGLFTSGDRACMANIIALTDWTSVRRSAVEILRRLRLAETDPDHMPMHRTWPQAQIDTFTKWVDDGTPKLRGEQYASFFRELDAVTEYFDVYGHPVADNLMPDIFKYFGSENDKALTIWKRYAVIPSDDPAKDIEKQTLDQQLADPSVAAAIKRVDAAMIDLLRAQLFSGPSNDLDTMLDTFQRFGADRLPEDPDRLRRIEALNDPKEHRLPYALYHRMDGPIMWMNWMGHVECAVTLYGSQDAEHGLRTAFMASVCLGYSADCVFRHRAQTVADYYRPDGEGRMWRKSMQIAQDFDKARAESHLLAQLYDTAQPAAVVAADVPVRFRDVG